VLILFCHLHLHFTSGLLYSVFLTKTLYAFLVFPHASFTEQTNSVLTHLLKSGYTNAWTPGKLGELWYVYDLSKFVCIFWCWWMRWQRMWSFLSCGMWHLEAWQVSTHILDKLAASYPSTWQVPLQCHYPSAKLQCFTSLKAAIYTFSAVTMSGLTSNFS
jgi:hypothetical protein